ncbi:3'(2'),5'-bisphosphate nucleotidase, partial [bacterium]
MHTTAPWQRSELHAALRAIAAQAAASILEVYGTEFAATAKADASPLTEADLRAHRLIVAGLSALEPRLPVLSEESAPEDLASRREWRRYWLVDPLDGTKEFVSRNGEFTVNIALIDDGRPVFGLVHVPVTATTYWGAEGVGAFRETSAEPARALAVRTPAATPLHVVGSRSHGSPEVARRLAALGPHVLHPVGSSLKLCLVAEGKADLYPRVGPTSEWDIASGQAIVEAAGGVVVELGSGAPLRYNQRDGLLNPDFLAAGDRDLAVRFLAIARGEEVGVE